MAPADVEPGRPQDQGRRHARRRSVEVRQLDEGERLALVETQPIDAYRSAIQAASWLYAADALAVVMLRDVLAELSPAPPAGQSIVGGPLPAKAVPIADRLKLWSLAAELMGELGLTADARRRIGLELTPPPPSKGPSRARPRRLPRLDFGAGP